MTQSLDSKLSDKDLLTGNIPYAVGPAIHALIADYAGLFGNVGSVDSLLTATAALGGMAGFYGRQRDAGMLAGLTYGAAKATELIADFLRDGRIDSSRPDLEKHLATYALAMLAGLLIKKYKAKKRPSSLAP